MLKDFSKIETFLTVVREKSFSKAMEFFKKACDLNSFGQGIGCGNYGNMYLYGWGVTPNFRKAIILFLKSCNLGAGIGCNNAGIMYEKGFGVEKNLEKAIEFYFDKLDEMVADKRIDNLKSGKTKIIPLENVFAQAGINV